MISSRRPIIYTCTGNGAIIKWRTLVMIGSRRPIIYKCSGNGAIIKCTVYV